MVPVWGVFRVSNADAGTSRILELALAGDPAGGWHAYEGMDDPAPQDDRWAGACLFNLGRFLEAKDLLVRALGRGCEAAGIELATVYRQLGEFGLASAALARLVPARLRPFDRALAHRELGAIRFGAGDLVAATEAWEGAWTAAHESAGCQAILPGLAQALGLGYSARGLDLRALHYLDRAVLTPSPARRAYARSSRGLCLVYLGRFIEAERDLDEAATLVTAVPAAVPVITLNHAILLRARGLLGPALERFGVAAALARHAQEPSTECYAVLGSCAVLTVLGRFDEASANLARARGSARTPAARAAVALREGALMAREQDPAALSALETAAAGLAMLGLQREVGWAYLQLSEAHLLAGRAAQADAAARRATEARNLLGCGTAVAVELPLAARTLERLAGLPPGHAARALFDDWRCLEGTAPMNVELRTLGTAELLVDGRRARLQLARSVEVLAYLLANPRSRRSRVLSALFPEVPPTRAVNYLHQVRLELAREVPGLTVPYDREARTYAVACEGPRLVWDVQELNRLVTATSKDDGAADAAIGAYAGPFLPEADTEWVRTERERLEWSVVKVGLESMERWYAAGEFKKCTDLATRLLELEPLNGALAEYLVTATLALEGEVSARRELERVSARFNEEVNDVPDRLRELARRLNAN